MRAQRSSGRHCQSAMLTSDTPDAKRKPKRRTCASDSVFRQALVSAPKGRDSIAQGEALGKQGPHDPRSPERAREPHRAPGLSRPDGACNHGRSTGSPGRCPGLDELPGLRPENHAERANNNGNHDGVMAVNLSPAHAGCKYKESFARNKTWTFAGPKTVARGPCPCDAENTGKMPVLPLGPTCQTGSKQRLASGTVFALLLSHSLNLRCKMLCERYLPLPAGTKKNGPGSGIKLAQYQGWEK